VKRGASLEMIFAQGDSGWQGLGPQTNGKGVKRCKINERNSHLKVSFNDIFPQLKKIKLFKSIFFPFVKKITSTLFMQRF